MALGQRRIAVHSAEVGGDNMTDKKLVTIATDEWVWTLYEVA